MMDIDQIRIDGGTQSRVQVHQDTVDEYAEAYKAGASFPPVIVYYDRKHYWLADGFHRCLGAKKAGLKQIYEEVIPGTQRDAVLYSLKANAIHGLKRTNADKRKAVEVLLTDAEWSTWSDNLVAQAAGVSHTFVAERRRAILQPLQDAPTTRTVERNGKTYALDISRIGKSSPARALNTAQTGPSARVKVDTPESAVTTSQPPFEGEEDFDLLDELKAAHAEITKLRNVMATDDKAAYAMRLQDICEVLQRRNDEHLGTIESCNRHIKFLAKQLDRCGKAVGEHERDKIAPAIEALARAAKGAK